MILVKCHGHDLTRGCSTSSGKKGRQNPQKKKKKKITVTGYERASSLNILDWRITSMLYSSPKAKSSFLIRMLWQTLGRHFQILLAEEFSILLYFFFGQQYFTGGVPRRLVPSRRRASRATHPHGAPPGGAAPGRAAAKWPPSPSRAPVHAPPRLPFRYLFVSPPPRAHSRVPAVRPIPGFTTTCLLAPRWRWVASTPCSRRSFLRRRVGASERRCGLSLTSRPRSPSGCSRAAWQLVVARGGSWRRRRQSRRPCRSSRRGRKSPVRPAGRVPPRRPPSSFWSLAEPAALVRYIPCPPSVLALLSIFPFGSKIPWRISAPRQ